MEQQIFYRFIRLNLTQFATFCEDYADNEKPLELSSSFRFDYDFDDNVTCCTSLISITKETVTVLKAELKSYFNIESESAASLMDDGCMVLPTELMTQFASLCYGSMRGVIYAKSIGTPLEKIILPPNDVKKIFNSPVKFRKQ